MTDGKLGLDPKRYISLKGCCLGILEPEVITHITDRHCFKDRHTSNGGHVYLLIRKELSQRERESEEEGEKGEKRGGKKEKER